MRADWGRRRPRATPLVQASPADSLPLPDEYAVPCTINGVMAAASGGALGFVFVARRGALDAANRHVLQTDPIEAIRDRAADPR